MKKIVIAIIIFLFTATVTSYAGIFTNNEVSTGQHGSLYGGGNTSSSNSTGDSGYGALYRFPNDNPGGRPEGGGIGQDAPIGDGLPVVIACCVALVVVKLSMKKGDNK